MEALSKCFLAKCSCSPGTAAVPKLPETPGLP